MVKNTVLDISWIDFSSATNITQMFNNMPNVTTILVAPDCSDLSTITGTWVFGQDVNLVGGNGTVFDSTKIDKSYARIDKPGQKGYFTVKH